MARMESPVRHQTVTVKVDPDALDEFDDWWDGQTDHQNRSEALRELIRNCGRTGGSGQTLPLSPPADDDLEWAYRRLAVAANGDGVIPDAMARRVCAGGRAGYSKEEARDLLLRPLHKSNYLRRSANVYGDCAWKLTGWDR